MNMAALKLLMVFSGTFLVFQGPVWAKDWDRGEIEYKSRCAVCHGIDAKGNGPLAAQLKTAPADLTRLAKKNEKNRGVFPQSAVNEIIDGRQEVEAHGPRDMPVWGYQYRPGEQAGQKTRQGALLDYLNRIQEK